VDYLTNEVLSKLERFGISTTAHGQSSLLAHLRGTEKILKDWGCPRYVCLAGLCHSIYGTESFLEVSATLDNREYVQILIGKDAERLAYLFGARKNDLFWNNLDRQDGFVVNDRFTDQAVEISGTDFVDLITMMLANLLDQLPTADPQYRNIRQEGFLRARHYLPQKAYQDFLRAYGLEESG
jgi:hypothetical protein